MFQNVAYRPTVYRTGIAPQVFSTPEEKPFTSKGLLKLMLPVISKIQKNGTSLFSNFGDCQSFQIFGPSGGPDDDAVCPETWNKHVPFIIQSLINEFKVISIKIFKIFNTYYSLIIILIQKEGPKDVFRNDNSKKILCP